MEKEKFAHPRPFPPEQNRTEEKDRADTRPFDHRHTQTDTALQQQQQDPNEEIIRRKIVLLFFNLRE